MRAFVNVCKRKETRDTRFPFRARFGLPDAVRAVCTANKNAEGHTLVAVEVVRNLVGEVHNFLAVGELHNLAVVEEVHNFLAVGVVHNLAVAEVGNLGEEDHILVEALLVQEL